MKKINRSTYSGGTTGKNARAVKTLATKKCFTLVGASLLSAAISMAVSAQTDSSKYGRNVDKRLSNAPVTAFVAPSAQQLSQIEAIKQELPGIKAQFNEYGATTSLVNPTGAIAPAQSGFGDPESRARNFVYDNTTLLGLSPTDIDEMELVDVVPSISGVTHYYYKQTYRGIPVYNGQMHVHVGGNGSISHLTNSFVPNLEKSLGALDAKIPARSAIMSAVKELNINLDEEPRLQSQLSDDRSTTILSSAALSPDPIKAKLVWVPVSPGNVKLAWNFQLKMDQSWPDITVDASTGELITSFDLTSDATFKVYPIGTESPDKLTPAPPADARQTVVDPEDATASPDGWFASGTRNMRGNNVTACTDRDRNNSCDANQPQCTAGLVCDFPLDLTQDPSAYQAAAIANLFYWNNLIHDVQYQYGFNEVGGNFQENNFGRGGQGGDSVNADAQDGGGQGTANCNANFSTPADGGNGRMQMFLCDRDNPERDGDLDNAVIAHEYGHGISIRQVGGPSNSSCLSNRQQGGEGWADWIGLAYTADPSDRGTDTRGIGSWLINLDPDTGTIRQQPYSTNPAVNSYTYESIRGAAVPHGVGSILAQALWEVYWVLTDEYGFEADLVNFDINDPNEAGNKRAMYYVNEGFKNTACSPTHLDARDGVIAAANNAFGGEDVCRIWEAFAGIGMGVDAISGGSGSTTPTNGFALPASCTDVPPPTVTCPDGSDPLYAADFESGSDGWVNGNSSCSTGNFVSGSPTLVTNEGVTTQVAGAASGNSAWFTAPNTAAGVDDVDGGTCETLSSAVDLSGVSAVEVSLSYFHGQRDAGDDAADGFSIEVLNDGAVAATMVSIGDETVNAAWTPASATINNPGDVRLRVRATDGSAAGDLVEGGVDKILFCAAGPVVTPTPTPTPTPPPGCTIEEGFEEGNGGWSNSSASSCSTGAFVVGTPNEQVDGTVVTQVGGANGGTNALFTAPNSSLGVDDVDGGNCIVSSPTYSVLSDSTLSVAYFHGQRDAGDDPNGDFFALEVSTDGGNTFSTLASNGDATSSAAWTTATASVPAGANVVLRAQCSDGSGPGDLVECGIDDVSICPQ